VTASDWVISGLTLVLVGATIFYAWQTRQTVEEMRAARATQVLPRLVPTFAKLPAGNVLLRIVNAGSGPAFNVDVELIPEPGGDPIRYVAPVMSPGEYQDFLAPGEGSGQTEIQLAAISTIFKTVQLKGSCSDALGTTHRVDEAMDIAHYAQVYLAGTWVRPEEDLKTIAGGVKKIVAGLEAVAKQLAFARRDRMKGGGNP